MNFTHRADNFRSASGTVLFLAALWCTQTIIADDSISRQFDPNSTQRPILIEVDRQDIDTAKRQLSEMGLGCDFKFGGYGEILVQSPHEDIWQKLIRANVPCVRRIALVGKDEARPAGSKIEATLDQNVISRPASAAEESTGAVRGAASSSPAGAKAPPAASETAPGSSARSVKPERPTTTSTTTAAKDEPIERYASIGTPLSVRPIAMNCSCELIQKRYADLNENCKLQIDQKDRVCFHVRGLKGKVISDESFWETIVIDVVFMGPANGDDPKILVIIDGFYAAGLGELPKDEAFRNMEPRYEQQLRRYASSLALEIKESVREVRARRE